jgi:uncharacterized damage-inducible protein DinB
MTMTAASTLSTRDHLRMMFSMNDSLLSRNLEGMTEHDALAKPGEGSAIAWNLGHIVYWRQAVLGMLGGTPLWSEGEAEGFKGTSRELPATIDRAWLELLAAYRESHRRLLRALEVSAEPVPDVMKGASQLQGHETYHIGQIALARRVLGLPGVI